MIIILTFCRRLYVKHAKLTCTGRWQNNADRSSLTTVLIRCSWIVSLCYYGNVIHMYSRWQVEPKCIWFFFNLKIYVKPIQLNVFSLVIYNEPSVEEIMYHLQYMKVCYRWYMKLKPFDEVNACFIDQMK